LIVKFWLDTIFHLVPNVSDEDWRFLSGPNALQFLLFFIAS